MAGKSAVLALKITGDAREAKAALSDVEDKTSSFGSVMGKAGGIAAVGLAGVAAGAVALGKASFDAASNLEQMSGSVDAVFGKGAEQVKQFAAGAADAVGLSAAQYDQMASIIGSQLKNAGTASDQLGAKTNNLIQMGADMSAVFGGSASDAVESLSAVMRGEFDPIEKYGVSINQTSINAELAARGQDKLTGAALRQAQVTAALDIVTKQTSSTHGQFAAQSNTAAEAQQRLGAWLDNVKARLGAGLLPLFDKAATFLHDTVAPAIDKVTTEGTPFMNLFSQIGTIFTTQVIPAISSLIQWLGPQLMPIVSAVGGFISSVFVPVFRAVWDIIANYVVPILKTVLAPVFAGIGDIIRTVTAKVMEHKDTFVGLYNSLQPFLRFIRDEVAPVIGGAFRIAFEVAGDAIGVVVDVISRVIDAIKWILDKGAAVGKFIGGLFGAPAGGGGGGVRGATRGAPRLFGASGGGGLFAAAGSLGGGGAGPSAAAAGLAVGDTYYITVTGALDPVAVADQIGRLLDSRARRLGQLPAFGAA